MRKLNHYRKNYTFRFASGVAGPTLVQLGKLPFAGEVLNIRQITSAFTDGAQTAQLTIEDEAGILLWDGSARGDGTTYSHEFATDRRVLVGNDTLKCTLSADPGASGAKIDVVLNMFGREA